MTELGKLVDEKAVRDAIHVAVVPVQAAEKLFPGQHIGIATESMYRASAGGDHIGIVDPFLDGVVFPGQWFYLALYPNTVTDMVHHWAHPAFPKQVSGVAPESERWLRNFAERCGVSYHKVIEIGRDYLERGECYWANDEGPRDEAYRVGGEYWRHWSAVTGISVPDDEKESIPFSCSC